jgi:hypothetical protein
VGNNLAAVSGTIEIDALTPVSGEIDSRRSGPRFPRPHLTRIAKGSGSECMRAITEARER